MRASPTALVAAGLSLAIFAVSVHGAERPIFLRSLSRRELRKDSVSTGITGNGPGSANIGDNSGTIMVQNTDHGDQTISFTDTCGCNEAIEALQEQVNALVTKVKDLEEDANVCYGGVGTPLEVGVSVEGFEDEKETASAHLNYGVVTVEGSEGSGNLLVDVMVQSILLSEIEEEIDDDMHMREMYGEVVANVFLYSGGSDTGTQISSAFGDGLIFAFVGTKGSTIKGGDDDEENISNGIEFKSVNTGKFYFPGVEPGSYLVRVEFDVTAALDLDTSDGLVNQDVSIGEHVITVTKVGNEGQCNFVEAP